MMDAVPGNKGKPQNKQVPPAGYKSAIAKARDAAKAKAAKDQKGKGRVAALVDELPGDNGEDTASEDGEFSACDFSVNAMAKFMPVSRGTRLAQAVTSSETTSNICAIGRFQGLSESQTYDTETLKSLNSWAHHVKVDGQSQKQKKIAKLPSKVDRMANYIDGPKKPDAGPSITVKHEKDIDKIKDLMPSLPTDRKGLIKAIQKISGVDLQPDEILAMIDSGSFEHVADADEDLPDHQLEEPIPGAKVVEAETACGGILKGKGTVKVHADVDGHNISVRFVNMKVKCPILSVRKLCKDGNEVRMNRRGGFIRHIKSGKVINFFEHQGVYYVKLRIQPPVPPPPSVDASGQVFARPGA